MNIVYHEKSSNFHLYNNEISYIINVLENGHLGHIYYGKKLTDRDSFNHMMILCPRAFAPTINNDYYSMSLETTRQEYPVYGTGDYRDPALHIRSEKGDRISDYKYKNHKIYDGKPEIPGLPATFSVNGDSKTLEIELIDEPAKSSLVLYYSIFENSGAVARHAKIINNGSENIYIEGAMSLSMDFPDKEYEMYQLDGAWAKERSIHKRRLQYGVSSISSKRGSSSHMHNPFIALARPNTTENDGEVYGFNLLYSGNFLTEVYVDTYDVARVMTGINPFDFEWVLEPGESFQTPEAISVYSQNGLNGMSQDFHNLFRNNLMRSQYKAKPRPILLNNWEATYFDFTEEKILEIAKTAKNVGVELFVLDDGWFGKRNDDTCSLGDWWANPEKLPNGIKGLSEKIHDLGLKFGLWFEPEMANEDSEIYREHPDWIISVPGRNKSIGRNQYVLDFANPLVVDNIFNQMNKVLSDSNIDYIKWDLNRNITEPYSKSLPQHKQKEAFHRYVLGFYSLYERLIKAFPNILFESCSGGGGRFDAGLLYYAPQGWTSDDTDAIERLPIQAGTSMAYPIASMGSHVSACPNHQLNRVTPIKTRGNVAYFGTFGYELDLNTLSREELSEVREQIEFFKEYREIIQLGDFYRLSSGEDGIYSWMSVSKDKKTAIFAYYRTKSGVNTPIRSIQLAGLIPNAKYSASERCMSYYGDELMNYGYTINVEGNKGRCCGDKDSAHDVEIDFGDYTSHVVVLKA